jgi:hypothetical protein
MALFRASLFLLRSIDAFWLEVDRLSSVSKVSQQVVFGYIDWEFWARSAFPLRHGVFTKVPESRRDYATLGSNPGKPSKQSMPPFPIVYVSYAQSLIHDGKPLA